MTDKLSRLHATLTAWTERLDREIAEAEDLEVVVFIGTLVWFLLIFGRLAYGPGPALL